MFYPKHLIVSVQEEQLADKDVASVANSGEGNDLRSKLERAEAEIERKDEQIKRLKVEVAELRKKWKGSPE